VRCALVFAADIPRVDRPVVETLQRLGVGRPIVLTQAHPRSRTITYRVPAAAHRRYPYRTVVLRFRLELSSRAGPGAGYVNLQTGIGPSASAEFLTRRDRKGLRIDWNFVGVRGTRSGSSRTRKLAFRFVNHMLTPDARPGIRRLAFRLQEYGRFRVRRVIIDPQSGIQLTREPPYPLVMRVGAPRSRLVVGRRASVAIQLHNRGSNPVRDVRVSARADPGMELVTAPRFAHWPPIRGGRIVRRVLFVTPTRDGSHQLHLTVDSAYGSPEATVRLRAVHVGPGGIGATPIVVGLLAIGALASAYVLIRVQQPGHEA
jgi:hypothetical protein